MSLSFCICLSCLPSSAAADLDDMMVVCSSIRGPLQQPDWIVRRNIWKAAKDTASLAPGLFHDVFC